MALVNNIDRAREQAQEAQKKLIELKSRVAKAQAKAELANKRAKQLRETLRALRASRNKGGLLKASLAAVVASQIGTVRAALVVQVQKRVADILLKFTTGCPSNRELQKIIKTRNNLLRQVSSFRSRVQKLETIARSINATVTAVKLLIKVITSIPLPTAIIPPMTGGLGVPVSLLTKYGEKLIQLNKRLDKLADEAQAITSIVSSIATPLAIIEAKLRAIDLAIQECSLPQNAQEVDTGNIAFTGPEEPLDTLIEIEDKEVDSAIDTFFRDNAVDFIDVEGASPIDETVSEYITQTVNNLGQQNAQGVTFQQGTLSSSENTDNVFQQQGRGNRTPLVGFEQNLLDNRNLYKGYELLIIQDPTSPKIAPRRYAVAKDKTGVVVLKGQPSFSSSTQILLDELKFRIDQLRVT
jgi:hypothetical protein